MSGIRILFPYTFQVKNPRNIKGEEFKQIIDNSQQGAILTTTT